MCLISDLSLFSNCETFQLSFEFHIQIGAEFHLSLHIVALLRGRPRCHVEGNVAWGWVNSHCMIDEQEQFMQLLLRQRATSPQTSVNYQVWADWEIGPVLFPTLPNMTGKNAPWIAANHLTHSNSRSKWFYEPYKKMNVVRLKVFLLWSSSWKLVCSLKEGPWANYIACWTSVFSSGTMIIPTASVLCEEQIS